jgi:hypothetical protein
MTYKWWNILSEMMWIMTNKCLIFVFFRILVNTIEKRLLISIFSRLTRWSTFVDAIFFFLAVSAYNREAIWARWIKSHREVSTIKLINFLIVSFTLVVVVVVERIQYENLWSVSDFKINRIRIEMRSSEREIFKFSRFSFIRSEFDFFSRHDNRDENEFNVVLNVSSNHDIAKIIVHEMKKNVMFLTIRENLE